jgi:hypothetical protein
VKQFENEVSPVLSLPDFDPSLTIYIRDSLALVQCMDAKKHRTFGDLGTIFMELDTGIGPTGCERMLSIVTSSLLLAKTRARLTVYDFTRFAFQGCFGIHVFKCFQF